MTGNLIDLCIILVISIVGIAISTIAVDKIDLDLFKNTILDPFKLGIFFTCCCVTFIYILIRFFIILVNYRGAF